MELSPEERKKIYEEEKARIDSEAKAASGVKKLLYGPEEIQEAIELGKNNISNPKNILISYSLQLPRSTTFDVKTITIATPYCNSAFSVAEKARAYEELSKPEIEEIINSNQILFAVTLRGRDITFAIDVKAIIKINDSIIRPIEFNYQEVADLAHWLPFTIYHATNQYYFPFDKLQNKQIRLYIIPSVVVYDPEVVIPIDLSKYK